MRVSIVCVLTAFLCSGCDRLEAAFHPSKPASAFPAPNQFDGVTFVGDRAHPVKIFQLSADGHAAVGYVFDVDKVPPIGTEPLDAGMPDYVHSYHWTSAGGVKVIKTRNGDDVQVAAISADGTTAVGCFYEATGPAHIFRWTEAGGVEDLGTPKDPIRGWGSGCGTTATAVSSDGSVIFGRLSTGSYRWTRATGFQDLHIPGHIRTASADGTTAAGVRYVDGGHDRVSERVVLWSLARGFEDLGAPPGTAKSGFNLVSVTAISADGSTIVGDYTAQKDERRGFRWTRGGGFKDLPGEGKTYVTGVSGDGSQIVGVLFVQGRDPQAVRWLGDGPPGRVGPPELKAVVANAISADGGTLAGRAVIGKGEMQSFVLRLK
jgi:uncharacterized membrane protein